MAKPLLSWTDKRVQKLWNTHACLARRVNSSKEGGFEYKFFCLDNLPDRDVWQRIKVVPIATSGLTITESLNKANKWLQNVRIKSWQKTVLGQVSTTQGQS
jgi:hypothetical protein